VILAGGLSARMGRFKPLLRLGGVPAIDRTIDLMRRGGVADIVVVVGHHAEELLPRLAARGVAAVVNHAYREGMYSSVRSGIAALGDEVEACFVLPVDIPLVRPLTIRRLGEMFAAGMSVLYPCFDGQRGHPPLIARRLFAPILDGDGTGGLRRMLADHENEAAELDVVDEGILLDMDTPEDLARLEQRALSADRPSPPECEAILARMRIRQPLLAHLRAVAAIGAALAAALVARGLRLDVDRVRVACLLHDLAKGSPGHAGAGARVLAGLGWPAVANLIAQHTDIAFAAEVPDEAAIVYLADKLLEGDRPVPLAQRFERSMARFAADPEAMRVVSARRATAEAVAAAVERALGSTLEEFLARQQSEPAPQPPAASRPVRSRSLGTTQSVCPVCLKRVEAERMASGAEVHLVKTCPEHGRFETVVWRGAPDYAAWGAAPAPRSHPAACATEVDRGCPYDCGLCPEHRQQSCCVLLEVTSRCNLSCPVCFASAGGEQAPDPTLAEIDGWLRRLREAGGSVNIQLSGGEPTVRNDLAAIIARIRALGFEFVQLNTNGVRIAQDPGYLEGLKQAGLDCVFLQFDGLTASVYRRIRGQDLLALKRQALANCAALGLGVVLVPVLVPGVNTMQIGDILQFAIDNMPTVRTVHFQPISYVGRFPGQPTDDDRITLPEVLAAIESQTGRAIRAADFRPGTAENPYCSFNGEFVLRPNRAIALARRTAGSCCGGTVDRQAAQQARRFVARRWSAPTETAASCCCSGMKVDSLDAFLEERSATLCISGMAFQDAWTLDLERLRQCHIHVLGDAGRLVPLCACNLSALAGETLYRRGGG